MASASNSLPSDTNPTSKGVRNDSGGSCKKEPADESITSPYINSFGTTFGNSRRYLDMSGSNPDDEPAAQIITHDQDMRSPRPIISFDGLCRPSNGTRRRVNETSKQAEERLEQMCSAVRMLLECVGEDPDREGLQATPLRYAKALLSLTQGYQVNVERLVNNAIFHEGDSGMVVVKGIDIYSLCEHHLVPFTEKIHIGYVSSGTVIGLSKLARIAIILSQRLQVQERLTKEVAEVIMEILKPQGVAVVMESSHLCMVVRAVEKPGSTTITSCFRGCFENKSKIRSEFMNFISGRAL